MAPGRPRPRATTPRTCVPFRASTRIPIRSRIIPLITVTGTTITVTIITITGTTITATIITMDTRFSLSCQPR
jgi:hypothetical protein